MSETCYKQVAAKSDAGNAEARSFQALQRENSMFESLSVGTPCF